MPIIQSDRLSPREEEQRMRAARDAIEQIKTRTGLRRRLCVI